LTKSYSEVISLAEPFKSTCQGAVRHGGRKFPVILKRVLGNIGPDGQALSRVSLDVWYCELEQSSQV